jgi:hypothetical protein
MMETNCYCHYYLHNPDDATSYIYFNSRKIHIKTNDSKRDFLRLTNHIYGYKAKGEVSPVYAMKVHRKSNGVASLILNFSIQQRRVLNTMPCPFYPQGRSPSTH